MNLGEFSVERKDETATIHLRGEFRVEPNLQITKLLELSGLGGLFELVEPSD